MGFCYVLLLTTLTFLAYSSDTLAASIEISRTMTSLVHAQDIGRGRLLRVAKMVDDTEERDIFSQLAEQVTKWGSITLWLNAGKTDDQVKQILGLEKLSGQALKTHPNYNLLDEFVTKARERQVDKWLNKDTSTDEVWHILGLDKLGKELTNNQLKESDALKTYIRYATKLDDEIWKHKRAPFEPEISSPEELAVKIHIWVKAERPQWYVFEMMGKNAINGNVNHHYYEEFLRLIRKQRIRG